MLQKTLLPLLQVRNSLEVLVFKNCNQNNDIMLYCMLRWYPIDTTTIPTWAYIGEVVFATSIHVGMCRIGTAWQGMM